MELLADGSDDTFQMDMRRIVSDLALHMSKHNLISSFGVADLFDIVSREDDGGGDKWAWEVMKLVSDPWFFNSEASINAHYEKRTKDVIELRMR